MEERRVKAPVSAPTAATKGEGISTSGVVGRRPPPHAREIARDDDEEEEEEERSAEVPAVRKGTRV